jgi:DNA polymerase-3 subunit gamma/tau
MFSGPRGCGKTTAARILAKAVNCLDLTGDGEPCCVCQSCRAIVAGDHMDVMEIDGASNRGIDQIRELKSHVGLSSFMGGVKAYILDEVHMLTAEAFNALLKTLEEPPPSVMFIFATTEPHKVPVTIRSRCLHIPFHRIPTDKMATHLAWIMESEGCAAEEQAIWEISRGADGALRDALSMAEQAIALGSGSLTSDAVRSMFGGGSRAEMELWISSLRSDPAAASGMLKELLGAGVSPERFLDALYPIFRDLWAYSLWGERSFAGMSLSGEEMDFLRAEAIHWSSDRLRAACSACAALFPKARWGLGAEVFSGMLLFDLMAASDAARPAAPAVPAALHGRAKPVAAQVMPVEPPKRAPAKQRPLEEERAADAPQMDIPEAFTPLWEGDLALCAALIDVRISRAGDGLSFDYSEAAPFAKAMLESPRAQAMVARALGCVPEAPERTPLIPMPQARDSGRAGGEAPPHRQGLSMSTIEEISARLGADLLMSKQLNLEDEAGDIGDIDEGAGSNEASDITESQEG